MARRVIIGLAAVLLVVGVAFGSYRAGRWPGTSSAASQPGLTFVVAQACSVVGSLHQIPPDLTDFVHSSCVSGVVSPTSEFATPGNNNDVPPSAADDVPD